MEPVLYTLRREGRGLVEASPQQQRRAYGKCPSYLAKTVMSSEWNTHFQTLSAVLRVCVSPPVHVRVCVSGRSKMNTYTAPTCCITFRPSSAVPQGCYLLNDSLMYIEWTAQQAHVHRWFILHRCDNVNILINQAVIEDHMLYWWLILITTCHPALDNTDSITHIRATEYKVECVCV